jgi:hypothetical protein
LGAPAPWDIFAFNLHLLREDMVSDLLAVLSNVWALAEHALISDDAHGEVVYCNSVILAAHHLGSHVARSAGCVFLVIWVPDTGDTEVSNSKVTLFVENEVLRLYVSMQDTILMQVLQA